jgi:hypothetical protein
MGRASGPSLHLGQGCLSYPMRIIPTSSVGANDAAMTAAETMRVWWAIMLSPNLGVCQSLLAGEVVTEDSLDRAWYETALMVRVVGIRDLGHLFPNVVVSTNNVAEGDQRAA